MNTNTDIREIWDRLVVSMTFELFEVNGVDSPKVYLMRHKEMPEFAILLSRYEGEGKCHSIDFLTATGETVSGWYTACWCCMYANAYAGPDQEGGLPLVKKEAQRAVDTCCAQHGAATILCRNTRGLSKYNDLIIVSAHRWLEFMSGKYTQEKARRGMWPITIHKGYAQE